MSIGIDTGVIGGIEDYDTLTAAVRLWLDRGTDLDDQMPTFVNLIEPYLNRTLRTPDMEGVALPTLANGIADLPVDYLGMRQVLFNGYPLDSMSPNAFAQYFTDCDGNTIAGTPLAYTIADQQIAIAPIGDGTLKLNYWQRIPSLTATGQSNWLVATHPDVYFYGTLAQAYGYINDPDEAANWAELFQTAVDSVKDDGNKKRYGGPIRAYAVRQVAGVRA